jgi:hypothetical protein
MKRTYFKPRGRFDFNVHTFDIGRPFTWWKSHYDRHFLFRLYQREESEFDAYYRYHLDYFLKENQGANEQEFFEHVWHIVKDRLKNLIKEDQPGSGHARNNSDKMQLREFMKYLESVNEWNTDKSKDIIIVEKEAEILTLKTELAKAKQELKEARSLETTDRIRITEDHLPVVIDLFNQFQELKLPDGKELLFSQTQSIWVKMICKYFEQGKNPISSETVRRYFPADKRTPNIKYSSVPSQFKLFKITAAKKRS